MTRAQASIVAEAAEVFFCASDNSRSGKEDLLAIRLQPSTGQQKRKTRPQRPHNGEGLKKGGVVFSKSYGSWPLGAWGGKKADQGGFEPPEHCCQGQVGFAKSNATSNGLLVLCCYLTLLPRQPLLVP